LTFTGVGRIGTHAAYRDEAVVLLIRTDIADNEALAEEMCGAFDYGHINPRTLSEAEVSDLLDKLVPTKEISGHHIGRFLSSIGQEHPLKIYEFIIGRLDHSAALVTRDEGEKGYVPVPHTGFGTNFHVLQQSPDYGRFLAQVRDRLITQPEQGYWLTQLFWAIGGLDTPTLSTLDEWLHSGEKPKIRAIINLISSAPQEFALARPFFALHAIEECQPVDEDLGRRAASVLIGNAHAGAFQRAVGQPSPRYVAMGERAGELRDKFTPGTIGHQFFSRLHDSAVSRLEQERIEDEELEFE